MGKIKEIKTKVTYSKTAQLKNVETAEEKRKRIKARKPIPQFEKLFLKKVIYFKFVCLVRLFNSFRY